MTRLGSTRLRWVAAAAVVAVSTAVSFLVAPTTRDAIAIAVLLAIFVAACSALSGPSTRAAHPVASRALQSLVCVDAALLVTRFLSTTTDFNLSNGAAISIVLVGVSFLTGASGQISLGNGAFMGVGAFTTAIWANHHATTPIIVTLVLAVVAGGLAGLLLGLPATRLRGPYLAGMTLAFAVAFGSILSSFSSWTGGDSGLQLPFEATAPHWLREFFSSGTALLTPNTVWLCDISIVVAGVAFFFMANLFASRTGRAMRLIRDNDVAAELMGVPLPKFRVIAFTVSASYAALGGALWTLINNSASPATYAFPLSVTILSLIVIGGIGTIQGALIGGLVYAFADTVISWFTVHSGLNPEGNLASQLYGIIFGGLLVLTMLFAPLGITGSVRQVWRRRRASR